MEWFLVLMHASSCCDEHSMPAGMIVASADKDSCVADGTQQANTAHY